MLFSSNYMYCTRVQIKAHVSLLSILGALHNTTPLYWNVNTLFIYHVFNGLGSLLGQTGSGTGSEPGGNKLFGHVRLSVPCGELVLTAVEWLQLLCEELLRDGEVCVCVCVCVCLLVCLLVGGW